MKTIRRVALSLLLCFLYAQVWGQNGSEALVATDLLQIRQLGSVTLSPGGRQVLYTVRQAEKKTGTDSGAQLAYEYRTHLYLAPADGSEAPRPLTRGAHSAFEPAWSPDGDAIAFSRPVDGVSQIFILPLLGGEPYPITHTQYGANAPQWSPDGRRILFASSVPAGAVRANNGSGPPWPEERPGRAAADTTGAKPDAAGSLAEIRAWLEKNAADNNPRVFTRLNLQGEHDLQPQPTYRHLYTVDAAGETEPVAVTRGYYSFGGGSWAEEGKKIIISGGPVPDRHRVRLRPERRDACGRLCHPHP